MSTKTIIVIREIKNNWNERLPWGRSSLSIFISISSLKESSTTTDVVSSLLLFSFSILFSTDSFENAKKS